MTDQTAEQRMAEVLAAHEDFGLYAEYGGDTHYVCSCDKTKRPGSHRAHVAAALAAEGFGDVRQAGAEALAKAADKWQWGAWTMLTAPVKAREVIAAAQVVTDWLRDRADRIGGAR